MAAKYISRGRKLTAAEAAHLDSAAKQAEQDIAEALARRRAAKAKGGEPEAPGPATVYDLIGLNRLVAELRQARESQGMSLADVSTRTGIDRAALNKLETRKNQNPTYGTLARYAAAVGARLTLGLAPADVEVAGGKR